MARRIRIAFICATMSIGPLVNRADAQSFTGLGDLPEGEFLSAAHAVSDDGSTVVGASESSFFREAFRWTSETGIEGLGVVLPGGNNSTAFNVNADGSMIVGNSVVPGTGVVPYRWTIRTREPQPLPWLGTAKAVSADGAVIVGAAGPEAVRWTETSRAQGLGYLSPFHTTSGANDVSEDGFVVVGSSGDVRQLEAFRWTERDGMIAIGDLDGGEFFSVANAVSVNGAVVVGYSRSSHGDEAYRWTEEQGMQGLGVLPNLNGSYAYGVSDDGSIVVGQCGQGMRSIACIWTERDGMRSLADVLVSDFDFDLTGWQLIVANDITPDGRAIVGEAINARGFTEGFLVTLPFPCAEDLDDSGDVGFNDLLILLAAWEESGPADLDDSGAVGFDDLLILLAAWGVCT